jgi:hypothetical protein
MEFQSHEVPRRSFSGSSVCSNDPPAASTAFAHRHKAEIAQSAALTAPANISTKAPLMTSKLTSVQVIVLYTKDIDRSRHFYGTLLGMHMVYQFRDRTAYQLGTQHLLLHPWFPTFRGGPRAIVKSRVL